MSRTGIFALFCFVNFLNFLDRGIIPGAPTEFQYFIQTTRHVPSSEGGFYLGVLSSSFVVSYAIFVLLFGYLSIYMRPFRLVSIGLIVWGFAVFLCGLAKQTQSFSLLLFGRFLSGIGESSFQCIAPAFIDDHAPPATRSFWLGVFYACSSVGMAFGVQYGAVMANSSLGWDWAFYIEALVVFPLAIVCIFFIPNEYNMPPKEKKQDERRPLFGEVWIVCKNIIFVFIVWGNGAIVFSLAGLSTFGTLFLVGLGVFKSDMDASLVIGCIVVASGVFGTPLGGLVLDWEASNHTPQKRQFIALRQLVVQSTLVVVFALTSWFALPDKTWFLMWYSIALVLYSASTSATITALLLCVEPSRRALATGVYALLVHVLGDVPSPIIIGALKDAWAPHCGSVVNGDGVVQLNPQCSALDYQGLLMTMLCPLLWMTWSALSYGAAYLVARYRVRAEDTNVSVELAVISNDVKQFDRMLVRLVFSSLAATAALAVDSPTWPPQGQCSVPGFTLWSGQCAALTTFMTPITVTPHDVGGFANVNMSSLTTIDEARAVLKGASAVNAMKGMRSEPFEYYNSSLSNIMITFCYLTSTAEDRERCVPPTSEYAQHNKGNASNTCIIVPGEGSCATKGLCERLPNCMWATADPTKPRLPRFTTEQIDAANKWVSESYAKSLAPYAGPGIALAVLTFIGFLTFFILRCFCNRCGGRDPVERGYTWCGVMTPGVAFFIFSIIIFICSMAAYIQNNTVTSKMHDLLTVLTEVITNLNINSENLLTPLHAIQNLQGFTTAQVQSILADTTWVTTGGITLQSIGESFDAMYTNGFPSTCIQDGAVCLTCPAEICGGSSKTPKNTLTAWHQIADELEKTFQLTRETTYSGATTLFSAANDAEDALTIVSSATANSGTTVNHVQTTFENISYARSGLVLSIFILGLFVAFLGMIGFLKGICKDKTKWVHLLHVSWGLGVILCIISFVVASCLVAVSAVWFDGCQYLDMVMNDMTPFFSAETSRVVGSCVKGTSLMSALGMSTVYSKSCEISERYRVAQQLGMMTRYTSLSTLGLDIMSYNESQFGWDATKHYNIVNDAAMAIGSDMSKMADYAVLETPWTLFNEEKPTTCTDPLDPPLCYIKVKCASTTNRCYTAFSDALVYTRSRNSINDKLKRMRQDFVGGTNHANSVGWAGGDKSVMELARAYAQRLELFVTTTITPIANLPVWTQVNTLQCTGAKGCSWINEEYAMVHAILCQDLLGACLNIALSVFMNAIFLLPMAICGIVLQKRLRAIRGGTYGAMEAPTGELTGRQKLEKKLEALTKGQTTL